MAIVFSGAVFDCADPALVADFWQRALGWSGREDGTRGEVVIHPAEGESQNGPSSFVFQPVPEGKRVKNRLHLDFFAAEQATEITRLEALGARRVDVGRGDDRSFVVLADVEGNEFCILSE
jgi:hypothetical protein